MRQVGTTGKNFITVSVMIFFSKVLGFCREIVFAFVFGTTVLTDAFQVIFSFPGLFFASIGQALSAVNIPDLTYYVTERNREERNQYIANLLGQITLICGAISLLGIIFAPALAGIIAPGLHDSISHITTALTRVMMPTLLFVSLTYITAGILQVHGHFLLSASISIPFNILIIASLLLKPNDIIFLGYITTAGWFLQFLIQAPALIREKYSLKLTLNFKDKHTQSMFRQLVPILLGNSVLQICLIVDRSFGTHLPEGTAAALGFGSNLFVTVTSVFIVAMSTVVFPRLSEFCLKNDYEGIQSMLGYAFRTLLIILLPYLILVAFYYQDIIALVYERGAFTSDSTAMTSLAFLFYSLAVPGYTCQEIFNRVFYALKKFYVPMRVSLLCVGLNVGLDFVLSKSFGISGISLSTAFCLLLYGVIMGIMIRRELGGFPLRELMAFAARLLLPAGGMLAVILGFGLLLPWKTGLFFLLPLALSGIIYLSLAYAMRLIPRFR